MGGDNRLAGAPAETGDVLGRVRERRRSGALRSRPNFAQMSNITSPKLLYLKAVLFVCAGILASGLLVAEQPSIRTTLLLVVAIWAFARAYFFAFYVIEHYIDRDFQFAGLLSVAKHLIGRRGKGNKSGHPTER